jgi:hypothetical protein
MIRNLIWSLCFFLSTIIFCNCSPGLQFDAAAYQRDTAIERKALQIVKHTSDDYSVHAAEIEALKKDIDIALAEEKKRKNNQATVKMWEAVQQDKGNLYDLFELWKTNGKVSDAISADIVKKIERLLISITELENFKNKS